MIVSLIAAVANNGVIGRAGELPWRLPDELRRFKALTMGHHLVVGRKTWESIGRPLPGRTMVVVTRDEAYAAPGATVVGSVGEGLRLAEAAGDTECFVGGGGQIYRLALPVADRIYLTEVDLDVDGDVTFPPLPAGAFAEVSREPHAADERHAHAFCFCRLDRVR